MVRVSTVSEQPSLTSGAVSVIIPAYNAEPFIRETVESVLAQTVPPVEIIVVNDGSTDGTAAVLRDFGTRIQVLTQPNRGPTAARNAGAAAARGHWLAFLDADDLWLPAKLERQLARAEASGAALVYTDRFNLGDRGDLPEVQSDIQPLYEGDVFVDLLLLGNHITASSVMLNTAVFRSVGEFRLPHGTEDWELWIRVAERHRVAACKEPLVRYRFHGGMMSGNPVKMQRARRLAVQTGLNLPRGRALSGSVRRRILAATANENANDAARKRAFGLAMTEYARAVGYWPFQSAVYLDVLRLLRGRA